MANLRRNDDRFFGSVLVAGMFALVGGVMVFVMWDFGIVSAAGIAIGVFIVAWLLLLAGWSSNPLPPPGGKKAPRAGDVDPSAGGPGQPSGSSGAPGSGEAPSAASGGAPSGTASGGESPPASAAPSAAAAAAAQMQMPEAGPDATPPEGTRPAALDGPRDGGPDDLKQIKGVGPKLEELCHSLGFYHFDQIAAWTADEVAWVDQNLEGFKGRVTRDDWVAQARALAAGETAPAERGQVS